MHFGEPSLISARDAATYLGFRPRTKEGKPSNHSAFLKRLAERHPEFPKPKWLGGRKSYELADLERFKAGLSELKADQHAEAA
jgi:hypothetical protein